MKESESNSNSGRSVRSQVLPPLERAQYFAKEGDAEIVAGLVVRELHDLPDSQRSSLVAEAASVDAQKARKLAEEVKSINPAWVKSKEKKASMLENSRKEDGGLDDQLKSMYRFPRAKF